MFVVVVHNIFLHTLRQTIGVRARERERERESVFVVALCDVFRLFSKFVRVCVFGNFCCVKLQ